MRFDWAALLKLGLTRLGLTPEEFWALTPVELMILIGPQSHMRPLDKTGLDALLRAYPDTSREARDD